MIAFDSVSEGHGHLHVMAAQGGSDRILTSGNVTDKRIYFASTRSGPFDIWSISVDGGAPEQVTFTGAFFPARSSDDLCITFALPAPRQFFGYRKMADRKNCCSIPIWQRTPGGRR